MTRNDRNARGRFQKGNGGGPGRPPRQTEREFLKVTVAACPLEEWKEIAGQAVKQAKKGDPKAREWLGKYLLGSPASEAPRLHQLVVEAEVGVDPIATDVARARLFEPMGTAYLHDGKNNPE